MVKKVGFGNSVILPSAHGANQESGPKKTMAPRTITVIAAFSMVQWDHTPLAPAPGGNRRRVGSYDDPAVYEALAVFIDVLEHD